MSAFSAGLELSLGVKLSALFILEAELSDLLEAEGGTLLAFATAVALALSALAAVETELLGGSRPAEAGNRLAYRACQSSGSRPHLWTC